MAKSYGADISVVYNTLKDLTNKDQQGFISPTEFNRFATIAQLNIFNGLFDELKDAQRLSRSGSNPSRDKSRAKRILEDLASFSTKKQLSKDTGSDFFSFSSADPAADPMARLISISTAGSVVLDQSTKRPIEICYDEEKLERILVNNLSAPTEEFPIALVSEDIYVFPTSINLIEVRYYKYPLGRVSSTGARTSSPPTYTEGGTSVDFELPEHYVSKLVYEIAKLAGINLRDAEVVNYSNLESQAIKQAEKQ